MAVRLRELAIPVDVPDVSAQLHRELERRFNVTDAKPIIVQRALDARFRPPRYVFTVDVELGDATERRLVAAKKAEPVPPRERYRYALRKKLDGPRPLVIGAGPAGLMAATVLAEAGLPPVVIERGKPVEARVRDVSKLYSRGLLDPESNVCFGEGGAGTFSDGKLYTRLGDERVRVVMETLVARGADADILVENRPHVGTDRLVVLLEAWRTYLTNLGVTWRFDTALEDFTIEGGRLRSVILRGGERVDAENVVLATGHSARHIWERLHERGLPLEARPFAVGFRVEHPQELIDDIRYGKPPVKLPAADYKLTYNQKSGDKRGVYSFCMCPGGVVVTTPTEQEALCINGMSHASRDGRYANSALVVSVTPNDFAAFGHQGVFAGVDFQLEAERKAYKAGGGAFTAPAARLNDFLAGRMSTELGKTSYRRGIVPADLSTLYPQPVIAALKEALRAFERQLRGFLSNEAQLIGVETRTASPIRVPRGEDLQAVGALGLYPAGEGMGFGGGIVSAAVDGMRVAEAMLERLGAERLRQASA